MNRARRNGEAVFVDGVSPLDYHGHNPRRLALVDTIASPADPDDSYFATGAKKIGRDSRGRPIKSGISGLVAFVDYDLDPDFDAGQAGRGMLTIRYASTRKDQRGKGHMTRLFDELLSRNFDVAYLDFGDVHSESVWRYVEKTARPLWSGRWFRAKRMNPTRNPFLAKPTKFHGRPAGGTHQLPGFHTASDRDQALPYAHQKGGSMDPDRNIDEDCEECDDGRCPDCLLRWRITDYPVVVGVDTSGLEPEHDVDARHVLENLMGVAREALRTDDPAGYFRSDGYLESETPSSVEQALFQSMARHEEDPAGAFGSYLEDLPDEDALAAIRAVAVGGRKAAQILMRVIGQFRYLSDVSSDRIVSIDYVTPIWDEIIDVQANEDEESRASALEAAGWDVLDVGDIANYSVHGKYRRVWSRPTPAGARVEWHGTGYRNLLLAAPELADKLPIPPLPYEETP